MSNHLRGLAICLVILFVCTVSRPGIVFAQGEPPVYAGRNINMVSGLYYFGAEGQPVAIGGDPYLQRQNEPSIAVSTRNPMHLLAGANDYRTVNMPFSNSEMVGDAWLGLFKSFDGGQTWQSTLLPNYPQSQADAGGTGCPKKYDGTDLDSILGCQAAADPTVRAGTNGMFYYSGIAFDRNKKHLSRLFVSRFIDLNNREGAYFDVPANKDSIKYIDTHVVNIGTPGQFTDKPWLAVDVPRGNNTETFDRYIDDYIESKNGDNLIETPTTVHQTFKCGNVYLAYSVFLGNFGNTKLDKSITEKDANKTHTRIEVLRSTDCGETWKKNTGNISENYHVNQGVTLAVDPKDGDVYVAWQVFSSPGQDPKIVVARSTDGGKSFGQPVPVADTKPFNQGTRPADSDDPFRLFRTNAYPTMAVDDKERVYVAWSERGTWGKDHLPPSELDGSRIMFSYSENQGQNWKKPYYVDDSDLDNCTVPYDPALCRAGHHIMPSLSYGGGKLTLLFYDFRNDLYPDLYNAILKKACDSTTNPVSCISEAKLPLDRSLPPADAIAFEPFPVRHTVDARIAVADATQDDDPEDEHKDTWPFYKKPSLSHPVSKYASTIMPDLSVTNASKPLKLYQLQSNQVNLPLFLKGTSPFIGDYIDIAASQSIVPDGEGEWTYNYNLSDASIFHAAWTDNRDVMPPPAKIDEENQEMARPNWTDYMPPTGAVWSEDYWPGMRNQNIYTSRITQGLVLGTYGNSKPLNIERAFSIFVENTRPEFDSNYIPKSRFFKLTLDAFNNNNVIACFEPLSNTTPPACNKTEKVVEVTSLSKGAVTVFAKKLTGNDLLMPVKVAAQEVKWVVDPATGAGQYEPETGGLQSSLVLNPDPTNPDPINVDANGSNLSDLETRNLEFVPFSCSDFEKLPDEVNTNCEDGGESVSSLLIEWPLLFDASDSNLPDPTLLNPALLNTTENPALLNPALLNPALLNPALLNPALLNPALLNDPSAPALLNPALLNPALLNPALLNPALLNPALLNPALLNPALLNDPSAPALLNPALLNSALLNPALLNPALLNPALLNPALLNLALLNNPLTPALLNPALLNPALLNPALLNPALLNPALLNPAPGTGNSLNLGELAKNTWLIQGKELDPMESNQNPATLTDLTWRVKNAGNNGSSYRFSWNSSSNQPVNPSQILVYRTYRTPSIDPVSYLLNEAGLHYEFLLNVLDAGSLTPGPHDTALRFSIAPASNLPGEKDEDYIYITLRFKADPKDSDPVVNTNEVAISVEPEASAVGTSTSADKPTFTRLFLSEKNTTSHNDEVTLIASVDAIDGTATGISGKVIFKDGSTELGEAPLVGNPTGGYHADFKKKLSAGSHTLTAKYDGIPGQFRASTSEPVIQHVKKLNQKIKFTNLPNLQVGSVHTLNAKSYDDADQPISSLVVSFSTHSKNCSVDGNQLKVSDSGMCVVKASQAGNEAYRPARPVIKHKKVN